MPSPSASVMPYFGVLLIFSISEETTSPRLICLEMNRIAYKYSINVLYSLRHSLELRNQLKRLQTLVVQIPDLVIQCFMLEHSSATEVFVEKTKKENAETVSMLEHQRVCVYILVLYTVRFYITSNKYNSPVLFL